jgi:hypothetical protein
LGDEKPRTVWQTDMSTPRTKAVIRRVCQGSNSPGRGCNPGMHDKARGERITGVYTS